MGRENKSIAEKIGAKIEAVNYEQIFDKLKRMSQLAAARQLAGKYWFDIKGEKRYVRLNSSNFRAVSLSDNNPCGHLFNGKEIRGKILKSALSDAANENCTTAYKPGKGKDEHKVQADIIWQSLTDPHKLPEVLCLKNDFDALWFVTEELSLPPLRTDLVLLGESRGIFFPVFVELKNKRTVEVAVQVKATQEIACHKEIKEQFRQFLASATGKPFDAIQMERSRIAILWPAGTDGPETLKMRRELGDLLTVTFAKGKEAASFKFCRP